MTKGSKGTSPTCHQGGADENAPIDAEKSSAHWMYSQVMDHLDVGIVVLDSKIEAILYQNNAAGKILENNLTSLDYQNIYALLLKGRQEDATLEEPLIFRSGNRLMGYSVYSISTDCSCILIRDITERSRLMSIAEAVNVMDNTGYIFSGIRHEIGNPINSIKITMSVLKHKLKKFSPEAIEEYVERCLVEISRVEYLLKSLKNFSLFENLQIKCIDLKDFLEKFILMIKSDFDSMGLPIKIKFSAQPMWAMVDQRALQQVLMNLLANARAALEDTETPEISLDLHRKEGLIRMRIQDNGCGIPAEDLKNIFKPFYTTKADGTGLGLVIARKMLAQMDSSIELQSQEGAGTIITILIPEGTDAVLSDA